MSLRNARVEAAAAAALFTGAVTALAFPDPSWAHAGLIGRRDLPIPDLLFAGAAAVILIISFVALSMGRKEPKLEQDRWQPLTSSFGQAIVGPAANLIAALVGVFLLVLVVWTGFEGTSAPDRNFTPPFVLSTFWLGMVGLSVVFGDVFRAFSPWRAIARAFAGVVAAVAGRRPAAPFSYPERLGRWPAAVGLVAFLWFELVYEGQSGNAATGALPETIATATLVYTAITLAGMGLFGIDKWHRRGEIFGAYYEMFASLSPFEIREGKLGRRPWLSGSTRWGVVPGSLALVVILIGGTSFDGAQEGALADPIGWLNDGWVDLGFEKPLFELTGTIFLGLTIALIALIFSTAIRGIASTSADHSSRELGAKFAHAFIPIGLAYLVAHYFSQFFYLIQAQFTYLLSDPFGDGSNILGTADAGPDYTFPGAAAIWSVMVVALAVGHVAALVIGHDRALKLFSDPRVASRSQYWMLALMVLFTILGVFLLSQSNE